MLRFFQHPSTQKAIERLAVADEISLFVGAGASKEVGLPTWGELVVKLARTTIPKKLVGTKHETDVNIFIQNSGALAAAERVAAVIKPSELRDRIHDALYAGDEPASLLPGPLARAAANLKVADLDHVRLITTNYDQMLVQALRDAGAAHARSFCTASTDKEAVIHLHGVVGFAPPADGTNEIVLTERDFLAPAAGGWRADVVKAALNRGPCLFVGVSLTDLNLLSPLYQSHSKHRHVVIFTRDCEMSADVVAQTERIEAARWKKLKVDCLFADNFADSSVFVHEVARRRRDPHCSPLVDRLRDWHGDVVTPFLSSDHDRYVDVQSEVSAKLLGFLRSLQTAHSLGSEVMQLGLFSIDLSGGIEAAQVLASSDRVMKDPRSREPLPLRFKTDWAGVRTMCTAVPVSEPKHNYASRWHYLLAVPVCLGDLSGAPVGAVVLGSTDPDSGLQRIGSSALQTTEHAKLYGALESAGQRLFMKAD